MSRTPIERAAEACLAYSSETYGGSGWKWDELKPETRSIWLGYARAALTAALDRAGLRRALEEAWSYVEAGDCLTIDEQIDAILAHLLAEGGES